MGNLKLASKKEVRNISYVDLLRMQILDLSVHLFPDLLFISCVQGTASRCNCSSLPTASSTLPSQGKH